MDLVKRVLKGRFLPNWMLLVFVIVVVILAIFGYRITYDPRLENNWAAIDAVGGWVSAVISGVAIWFAVFVPKRIAQEQNDIALFERRFASYNVFLKYTTFAELIKNINTLPQLRQAFLFNFLENGNVIDPMELILIIKNDERKLMSGLFLFSNFCDGGTIHDILKGIIEVASLVQYKNTKFS